MIFQNRHAMRLRPRNPAQIGSTKRATIGLLFFVFVCALPARAQPQPVTLLTEEWAPYNYSEQGRLVGFSVEIVRAMLKELKVDGEIELLPGLRAIRMLNSNPRTMMLTILRTPEREQRYKWIGPLGDGEIYFYKRKGDPLVVASLDDAKKVRMIACRNAGLVHDELLKKGFANLEATATNGEAIYRKLLAGRCELGVSDAPIGVAHLLKKWGFPPDTIVPTSVKVVSSPLYIACSKDIPDSEIAAWQAALDRLKASGEFGSIRRKYGE